MREEELMKAKDIMSKDVKCIHPEMSLQEAAKIMRDKDVGALPICGEDQLVGVVTDRDIVVRILAEGKDAKASTVRDAMSARCLYCFDEDGIDDVAKNMAKSQIRRLPVLNKDKRLVGILALADLCCRGSKQAAGEALHGISQKNR